MSQRQKQPEPEPLPGHPAYLIDGTRYPLVAIDTADLWDVIEIKRQTGLTVADLERCLVDISRVGDEGAPFASEADVFNSEEHLMALGVQMWLARKAVGEDLTIREASNVPLGKWVIVTDAETAEPEDEDPTSADGVPAAGSDSSSD